MNPRSLFFRACLVAGGTIALATPAQAQNNEWDITVSPYLWLSAQDGTTSVVTELPPVEVDASFGDIFENLDIAAMAIVEADNGKIYLRSDFFYASLGADAEIQQDPRFSAAELSSKVLNLSAAGGVVAHKDETSQVNLFAGVRLWSLDNEIILSPGTEPGVSAEADNTFVNPIVGASASVDLSPSVSFGLGSSIGGFGIGDTDIELSGSATVEFEVGPGWSLAAGYRVLYIDYENGAFVYDVTTHGPLVGARINF